MNDRIAELEAALKVAHQALIEVDAAQDRGPWWYTNGESGLRAHVRMWVKRGLEAIHAAQAEKPQGDESNG